MGVPVNFISKSPSPDLLPGLTDEDLIGMSFKEIERILTFLESGRSDSQAKKI
jgi:NAD+ synthase